jgi:RNA polymerase sigma-70 factor (ECF subfamily)
MTESFDQQDQSFLNPREWVDRYGDYLFRYAYSRLRDRVSAEDAVQDTFLAALKARSTFAARSSERSWLVGILKHKIVDHLRKKFLEHPGEQPDVLPCEKEHVFGTSGKWRGHWIQDRGPIEWGGNPSEFLEKREFWEVFERCLKELPPRLASAFTLHQMEEMKPGPICKELGITPTNLWVMLHRTRKQLRRCLEINWIGGAAPDKDR